MNELSAAVVSFAERFCRLSERHLNSEVWQYGSYEQVRYAFLHTTLELRLLASRLLAARTAAGNPLTRAQHLLGRAHIAYRRFESLFIGMDSAFFAAAPAPGEWAPCEIVRHVYTVERNFFAAIQRALSSTPEAALDDDFTEVLTGEPALAVVDKELASLWAGYSALHQRIQQTLQGLTETQLQTPSRWWEDEAWPIEFRLARFDAHLSEHNNQLEKMLMRGDLWLESGLLIRQIGEALAEVESMLIGAPDVGSGLVGEVVAALQNRSDTLSSALTPVDRFLAAVTQNDLATVAGLLNYESALAGGADENGLPLTMVAHYRGYGEMVQLLLSKGLQTSPGEAAALGDLRRVKLILEEWPPALVDFTADGFQPLHLAAFFGHTELARFLLAQGAPVTTSSRNSMRVQPLHSAVAARNAEIVRLLIAAGADVNARQQDDFTPLMAARQNGDAEIEQMLLEAGAVA